MIFKYKNISYFYGHSIKRIKFNPKGSIEIVETWIENIGSMSGILTPAYGLFVSGEKSELLCFYINEILVFKNSKYTQCYYENDFTNTSLKTDKGFCIFPNPVDNILTITSTQKNISQICIIDILGKIIFESKVNLNTDKQKIEMHSFSEGIYFLKIYEGNKNVYSYRIFKNK